MEEKVDSKLKEVLSKSKFWKKIYKTTPNPKIERYKAVADTIYLDGDKDKKLREYCDEMQSKEMIYMQNTNPKQDLEHMKWWLETYNPQSNMVRYFAHEKIRELEKKLQLK